MGDFMNIINRILRKINKLYQKNYKNKSEFKKMVKNGDDLLNSVKKSLVSVINRELSQEELKWIQKIENLRKKLKESSVEIEVINFGAGSPESELSTEDMFKGRTSQETISQICHASVPYLYGLLLFKIIRNSKPANSLELGTCLGMSTSYIASALEINNKGKITTIEGAPSLSVIAKENLEILELQRVSTEIGRFQDVLDDILKNMKTIDYAFIDGHHDEIATIEYFNKIFPFLSQNAIIMFDDINWSKGMKNAWNIIKRDKRIKFTVDLYKLGICVVSTSLRNKNMFKVNLY